MGIGQSQGSGLRAPTLPSPEASSSPPPSPPVLLIVISLREAVVSLQR